MFLQRKRYRWQRAPHHRTICDALMRVYRGECTRLIINVPPRYSKTELAVVNFIAWAMGRTPDAEFIHASYSGTLAVENSANIRAMIQHEAYREIFPDCQLATEAKAHWKTTQGGVMYAAGAGGTITGFGAGKQREGFGGAIIIDDPHKADEARSDTIREGVIEWFQNTLESRKNDPQNTPIILIMQRLHERDLAGWLLAGGNGEEWEHVCLPALIDEGGENERALWPEKHPVEKLKLMQKAAPYTFAGQMQQSPNAPAGNIFKPDSIPIVAAVPVGTRFVRGWDFAATEEKPGKDPDWTAGGKLGQMPDGRFIIADVVKLRGLPNEVEDALKNTAARDGVETRVDIPQDPGQAGKSQVAYFTKQLAGFAVSSSPESGDKITRAEPFASQCNVGNVVMLQGEWNDSLIAEMRLFPNGAHDDQVDALSRAFAALNVNSFGLLDFMRQQQQQETAQ